MGSNAKNRRISLGIPKVDSNLLRITPRKKADIKAPVASTKNNFFGFIIESNIQFQLDDPTKPIKFN